jgi:hypothetical protein
MQRISPEARHAAEIERLVELRRLQDQLARQVLLVVLECDRHRPHVHALAEEVLLQVLQALQVVVEPARLAVGHEHDAIGALQHQLARRVVVALPRHGVELELGLEP